MIKKLGLGTVQFGLDYGLRNSDGQVPLKEVQKILSYAKSKDIRTIDTASEYGESEKILGKIGVKDYEVITKTKKLISSTDNVVDYFYKSLDNLMLDRIDGLLIHDFNDVGNKNFEDLFKHLKYLQQQGLFGKIGFSIYNEKQVDYLLENFDFDLIQVPINVFDTRLLSGGQLSKLQNRDIEVHARSIFLQGLLINFKDLPDYFSNWEKQFDGYQAIVKQTGLSLMEYALNFVLNIKGVNRVLVGVNTELQLREIVRSVKPAMQLKAYPIDDTSLINPSLWNK